MTDVSTWLTRFGAAINGRDGAAAADLFAAEGLWRDYLARSWTLMTHEGVVAIAAALEATGGWDGSSIWTSDAPAGSEEGFIAFETPLGRGRGYMRLVGGQCTTLFTALEEIRGFEEARGVRRPSGLPATPEQNWRDVRAAETAALGWHEDPYVLVVGAGQGGVALGARLRALGVSCLIVDKYPRVGDQWRSRYKSLTLHDPVWYDHLPYLPFPDTWPLYTPKDKMGDWLEHYADVMELNIWLGTECVAAEHDVAACRWTVRLRRADGSETTVNPVQLVMAVGNAGFPRVPKIEGCETFAGHQYHSSAHPGAEGLAGRKVVVVGANNSAHDIAADLVLHGAEPVMLQRSSTLIVRQSTLSDILLQPVYSEEAVAAGLTTDKADIIAASLPLRMQEQVNREAWDNIRELEAPFYDRLEAAGFRLDFGEDGTGLAMKYQRSASGYYIDVGACEMVADGRIGLRTGEIDRIVPDGVILSDGSQLPAELIVYATGFGSMEEWVARLISPEVAAKVGRCWGYGSGFKGDPGPWEGELRNMWKPTAQQGLWFMGGNLAQARFYSGFLALQLKARLEGLVDA